MRYEPLIYSQSCFHITMKLRPLFSKYPHLVSIFPANPTQIFCYQERKCCSGIRQPLVNASNYVERASLRSQTSAAQSGKLRCIVIASEASWFLSISHRFIMNNNTNFLKRKMEAMLTTWNRDFTSRYEYMIINFIAFSPFLLLSFFFLSLELFYIKSDMHTSNIWAFVFEECLSRHMLENPLRIWNKTLSGRKVLVSDVPSKTCRLNEPSPL